MTPDELTPETTSSQLAPMLVPTLVLSAPSLNILFTEEELALRASRS
jgi:hypothetical protein